jgi:DNA invertase Pin-like site-specific DNA recombinase
VSEGLAMPVEASERLERSQPAVLADMMARLNQMFAGFERLERLVEHTLERLERSQAQAIAQGSAPTIRQRERSTSAHTDHKAALLQRLRAMQAEGLSLQAIANRLNNEQVPTLSGKGRWQKGTIGNLLAQEEK